MREWVDCGKGKRWAWTPPGGPYAAYAELRGAVWRAWIVIYGAAPDWAQGEMELGNYATLEQAKAAVEVHMAASKKEAKKTTVKALVEDAIVEVTMFAGGERVSLTGAAERIKAGKTKPAPSPTEKLASELAEKLQAVVMAVENGLSPKLGSDETEVQPGLDGEVMRERRSLTTQLTREEVEAHGHELAETVQKLAIVEVLIDILKVGCKPTLKSLDSRENALSGLVLRKERVDAVLCAHVLTADASVVEIIRLDTGAVIDRRKPKGSEGQTRMGGVL